MSAPRCIRMAIEACKPCKTYFSHHPPISIRARQFSSTTAAQAGRSSEPGSITQGFPDPPTEPLHEDLPEEGAVTGSGADTWIGQKHIFKFQPTPKENEVTEEQAVAASAPDAPPKRSAATMARPSAADTQSQEQLTALVSASKSEDQKSIRPPRNVAAAYLKPLRRTAQYGVPTCDLQLRSYSVRNVEFMADFAMRAAYYLGLPARGPTPLPKRIERWTMPRSNFVHKKSQENFERITLRRLVQIQDGHPETVQVWLAFLRKHAFYGVGMKANVWQHEELEVGKNMDKAFSEIEQEIDAKLATFGWNKNVGSTKSLTDMMQKQGKNQVGVPMLDVREASRTREQRI